MFDPDHVYLRDPDAVFLSTGDRLLAIDAQGHHHTLPISAPRRWSSLLEWLLVEPRTGASLAARVRDEGDEVANGLETLQERGLLLGSPDRAELERRRDRFFTDNAGYHFARGARRCEHLVVVLTGSIVAGLVAPALLSLCYAGFQGRLDVVITRSAQSFVQRDLFEAYGIRTWVDAFDRRDGVTVPHIALAKSADCVLVLPATASSFHRIAEGACSDLLSLIVSATKAPVVMAPTMNDAMWAHKPVQRNVQRVRDDGLWVMEPTLFVEAAEVVKQGPPMYGVAGTMWRGAQGIMQTVSAVLDQG